MSYILEALRKAEKQREIGQVPGIESVHEPVARSPARRWPWALALILILNVLIVGALYWSADDAGVPTANTAAAPPGPVDRPADSTRPGATGPVPGPAPPDRTAGPHRPMVADPKPSPALKPAAAPKPAPEPETKTAPAASGALAQPPSPAQSRVEAAPLKPLPVPKVPLQASPTASPEKRAPDPVASPRTQPSMVPEPEQLPVWPLVADDLYHQINADLDVNVHVYSKNREKSFVFLNMKIYHEGDQLLEGPRIEQITQDGVILSFRGERFRVPAR